MVANLKPIGGLLPDSLRGLSCCGDVLTPLRFSIVASSSCSGPTTASDCFSYRRRSATSGHRPVPADRVDTAKSSNAAGDDLRAWIANWNCRP